MGLRERASRSLAGPWAKRVVADGLVIFGIVVAYFALVVFRITDMELHFWDGLAYWGVDRTDPYGTSSLGLTGSFIYSPPAALVFGVIGLLPQAVFIGLWAALIVGLAAWLGLPFPRIWLILLAPLHREIEIGQFNVVTTAAIVLAFRWPALWAIPLLTKVTPGVGLIWFAVRREWRRLAIAVGVTAAVAAGSFAIRPEWWFDWFGFLRGNSGYAAHQYPLVRIAIAALVVAWGAKTDRPWTVPLGAFLALPVIYLDSFTFLLGCVAVRHEWIRRAALGDPERGDAAATPAATPAPSGATG
jgi:hypothetical protein